MTSMKIMLGDRLLLPLLFSLPMILFFPIGFFVNLLFYLLIRVLLLGQVLVVSFDVWNALNLLLAVHVVVHCIWDDIRIFAAYYVNIIILLIMKLASIIICTVALT